MREVCDGLQKRVRLLHFGLQISLGLSMFALAIIVLAYALDKVFCAP